MEPFFRKREGQVYVQTWHGTPLKKIGFDIEHAAVRQRTATSTAGASDVAQMGPAAVAEPVQHPDLAARVPATTARSSSPGTRATTAAHAATRPRGRGGARAARHPGRQAGRAVRADLAGRPVLRAPAATGSTSSSTWSGPAGSWGTTMCCCSAGTTTGRRRPGRRPARVRAQRHRLSRTSRSCSWSRCPGHRLLVGDVRLRRRPAGRCCSSPTTWSSTATTCAGSTSISRRQAPGPLLATSEEVIAAIGNIDSAAGQHRGGYQQFREKFCALDDGKAGARACDRIFGG